MDQLARLTTALADRYTIERQLGAGGMTTVWRTRRWCQDNESEPSGMVVVENFFRVLEKQNRN